MDIPDRLSLTPVQDWEAASAQMKDAAQLLKESLRDSHEATARACLAIIAEESKREIAELERIASL